MCIRDRDTHVAVHAERHVRWALVREMVRSSWRDLSAASVAQTFAQMIRAGRQTIIPFYGLAILGLNAGQVGLIQSASSSVDMILFIPAGYLMDRFGRKVAAVPSFAIMAVGMVLIPFTTDYLTLMAAATIIGLGNGLGTGTMMTLGADLAPPGATGEFLGLWRLIGDTGRAGGPPAGGRLDWRGGVRRPAATHQAGVLVHPPPPSPRHSTIPSISPPPSTRRRLATRSMTRCSTN